MELEVHKLSGRTTVRGELKHVQGLLEEQEPIMGFMTLGAAMAMAFTDQKRVFIDMTKDPEVDEAPFEVSVTLDEKGSPKTIEFKYLEEEEVVNG